jgi:hypothetical protein
MKPIKAPLAFYKQHYQDAAGNTYRKSQYIDEGVAFVLC